MALDRREFEQLMFQAQTKLPGASDNGIKAELYDVLKEFFRDSNAWREDIKFTPIANQHDYVLTPLEEGQIIRLMGVWDGKGIPIPAFMHRFGEIRLVHKPSVPQPTEWFARVVKNVTLPTTRDGMPVAPDWTLQVYSVDILDGLLGKMMGQQTKSYSNGTLSTYHLRRFRTAIQIARTAAARDNVVGAQEWAYPRGWGSITQRGGVSTAWPTRAL
jgi:hypothetical protein